MIKSLNFEYSGPIDGHDLDALLKELNRLKHKKGPKFLHIITTKGKGMQLAEEDQVKYHAPGKFNPETGEILPKSEEHLPPKFQDVFGHTLVELAQQNEKIIGITPAMPTGSSMKFMMEAFPKRAIDVGIAEQHAVTLAAGMATQGMVVFCNIYSTFMQRAYDQLIHDVALQNLPVIFCLDRAGLVGEDGATHHGAYDLAYLNCVPDMILCAPKDELELRNIMYTAQLGLKHPIAIRYPRGRGVVQNWQQPFEKMEIGKAKLLRKGSETAVLSTGFIGNTVSSALNQTTDPELFSHYHFPFVKPLDTTVLKEICENHKKIITIEDGTVIGGFGSLIASYCSENNYSVSVKKLGIPDEFIEQGTVSEQQQICGIDVNSLKTIFSSR